MKNDLSTGGGTTDATRAETGVCSTVTLPRAHQDDSDEAVHLRALKRAIFEFSASCTYAKREVDR